MGPSTSDPERLARFTTAIEPSAARALRSSLGLRSDLQARLRTHTVRWISAVCGAGLAIIIAVVAMIVS